MLYLKVFSQFLFYLVGTFLHEIAHFAMAKLTLSHTPKNALIEEEDENGNIITKKVSGFTIIPRITKNQVVYGHVLAIPKYNVAYIPIAIAPFVWIIVLYYLLSYFGFLNISFSDEIIHMAFSYKELFTVENWFILYISMQLLWAGTLSTQDIKMAIKGVFSISFFVLAATIYVLYMVFMQNAHILNSLWGNFNV